MKLHPCLRAALCGIAVCSFTGLHAEEGGSGHYLPGSMASFIDGVPPDAAFIARLNFLSYEGSLSKDVPLPIAGLSTAGVEADSIAAGLTLLWRPGFDMGERWSYAMSATVPFVWMDVSADVNLTLPGGLPARVRRSDNEEGLGDIILMPLMVNYKANDDFNVNFRIAAYAPTGDYEVGRLANPGKNYWSFEPTLGLMYLGKKSGLEASLFTGYTFNSENDDTDYDTGDQVHLDGTLAQHLPAFGGLLGLGINGYWYQQVTGDSGSGANFGSFKGRTAGLGPVLSWTKQFGETSVIAEVKWLNELETERRLEGNYIWFKLLFKF